MNRALVLLIMMVAAAALDYIWIGNVMNRFYLDAFASFGRIAEDKFVPLLWAAGIVYLILPTAIYVFVILPAHSLRQASAKGALFGLLFYGLYDFTNLATIQGWSVTVTFVDVTWGIVICAILSALGYQLIRLSKNRA